MKRFLFITTIAAVAVLALTISPRSFRPSVAAAKEVDTVPLFRLFNKTTGTHFYTTDTSRKVQAMAGGWTSEGVQAHIFKSQAPGTVPLYVLSLKVDFSDPGVKDANDGEFSNAIPGYVFGYTTSPQERDTLLHSAVGQGGSTWVLDSGGIAGYVAPKQLPGTVPLYKLYHPKTSTYVIYPLTYDNWYTTSEQEVATAQTTMGYQLVGVTGYVWPKPASLDDKPAITPIPKNTGPVVSPDTALLQLGCLRDFVGAYNCPTVGGFETCQAYKKRGAVKECTTTADLDKQLAMEQELFSFGCDRFLGRPDQFMCKTQKAMNMCKSFVPKGQVTKCIFAK